VGIYRRLFRMRIGRGARLDTNCVIWGPSRITIGSGSVINRSVLLDGRMPLKIGDNSSISLEVMILTLQHDLAAPDFDSEGSPVEIGDRVFVGARAVILPGIIIGDGAAVAAGAVVTKDVAPYTIVGGNPARPIGTRPRDLRYRLDRL
jgi:acetyltransferase-like isoleucine patch superfamily enzyme